jgi:hypothetical protein
MNWSKWHEIEIPTPPRTGNCRYCKHTEWDHNPDEKGLRPCVSGMWGVKCASPNYKTIIIPNECTNAACPCMEYVPGDNLAYLEWKDKRGY